MFGLRVNKLLHLLLEVEFQNSLTQSVGAAEYTDCISTEGKDSPTACPGYNIKPSDGEVSVMLELWGMRSTPSLPLLPGPL